MDLFDGRKKPQEANLIWKDTSKVPGGMLAFDAVLNEHHGKNAKATEHPVESGSNISDHVQVERDTLELQVMITQTPIDQYNPTGNKVGKAAVKELDVPRFSPPLSPTPGALYSTLGHAIKSLLSPEKSFRATVLDFGGQSYNFIKEAQDTLWSLINNAVIIDVFTTTRLYQNMLLEEAPMVREAGKGGKAIFTLKFTQLETVSATTTVVPRDPKAVPKKDNGKQNPKAAPTIDKSSVAGKLVSDATGKELVAIP